MCVVETSDETQPAASGHVDERCERGKRRKEKCRDVKFKPVFHSPAVFRRERRLAAAPGCVTAARTHPGPMLTKWWESETTGLDGHVRGLN